MRRLFVLMIVLAVLAIPSFAPADTYPRQAGVDVQQYVFRVTLHDDVDAIEGVATADLVFREAGVTEVVLDLIGTAGDGASGMTVTGVWVAGALDARRITRARLPVGDRGTAAAFEHVGDRLRIQLTGPSPVGQRAFVTIAYQGTAADALRIGPNKHGERTFFSDNWPSKARNWLPVIDHPYDKAASQMVVIAPSHYQVVSNGLLVEETDRLDGTRLTHWKQSVPIAPWLYVLGAARFSVHHDGEMNGAPIQTWVYPQDRDTGFETFPVPTFGSLKFFSDNIGPFAYEKLANIQAASVGGGMEAASAILYGEESASGQRPGRWRNVIVHEIAHQWFGNAVTESDWDDVWLSEGFATYFTLLYREHADGRDDFVAGLKEARERVFSFYDTRPDYRVVHDNLDDMSKVTTGMQYQKGAWTLHMLRGIVGTDTFWEGIRAYYREYRDANASTADFRRVMEEASGQELGWFFDQWLRQGGIPAINVKWRYDADAAVVRLTLSQVQAGSARFRGPITVRLRFSDGSYLDTRVDMAPAGTAISVAVEQAPSALQVDPETWVLARTNVDREERP